MKNLVFVALASILMVGCPLEGTTPGPVTPVNPTPRPGPGADVFGDMCQRMRDLRCEEGNDVYNDNLPGPVDEANQSCEGFYKETEDLGVKVNPKCVRHINSCSQIEELREKDPDNC